MGLAIEVGPYGAYEAEDLDEMRPQLDADMARINTMLAGASLPPHTENQAEVEFDSQAWVSSFPYRFLHFLRAVAYHHSLGLPLPDQLAQGYDAADDYDGASMLDSHLLNHSDCDGYYVPIDFDAPLVDDEYPGVILGSSVALQRELLAVAAPLGIEVESPGGRVTADSVAALEKSSEDEEHPCWIAREVWLTLYDATRASIAAGQVIVFQ
ncbi:uncharacterized protein LOC62_04G006083 [Vanrija pseudolonga]|uniref:Uncharacterized protein n=1 Tax=Vanrija pseudolonga TaxID=143232 RepID=A0AAF1BRT7_9TREE|nr:hypothetical protein LOC62_04G006083 [Vanrija pseudolonga]